MRSSDGRGWVGRNALAASTPSGWGPRRTPPQRYEPGYGYTPGSGGPDEETGLVTTVLGIVTALGAVLVFVCTFLPWIQSGAASSSGVDLMTMNAEGFFMVRWGWGGMLFTGFFGLVMGAFMVVPAMLFFLNKRSGASWSVVTGFLGFFVALVDVIMVYSTYDSQAGVGVGLWLMLVFSVAVLVCGVVGLRYLE